MMGRFPRTLHVYLFFLPILVAASPAFAQVSLTTLGTPYTQNFDTLPASGSATWTNNSNIPGWFHARTGTGITIVANDGSSNAGNLYSYGTGTATDRALGSIGSGNAAIGNLFWGVRLQNNTGATITSLDVSYTGEQWRNSAAAAQTLAFSYLVGSPTVTGSLAEFQSAGVAVPSMDFTGPITGGAAGALNGNLAANRVTLTFSITGLSIPNGTEVMVRWSDPDHTGADHGLSIDDFAVTPQGGAPLPTLNVSDVVLTEGNAPGTSTFTFAVTLTSPAGPGGVTFDIATADGTAQDDNPPTEDNDYVAQSLTGQSISSGSTGPYNFSVTVNRDATPEPNETFFVNVTNVTGANAGDTQGQGTIQNDDVSADLAITKTDGVTTATPGGSVTYTVTASNAGPNGATGANVTDTFPAILTCTWTCVGAGGGTCTAAGSGNINDTVNLPAGASVTYTASCTIAASASGSLSNTATVSASAGVSDPDPGNNSATDTDTVVASADLAVTKTDGVTTATPGGSVTYTITASNAGPSNAPGTTVADTFPAALSCTWTCAGAGGGTCTAAGAGNINDTVNLPVGGSVTYTASCTIGPDASGSLSNTASVGAPAGVTDPNPANNSATDTDTPGASADLAVTKTDGVATATPGGSVTYTITASNAGPSNAPGATVADTIPAVLTCTWTCAGTGGGICTAAGTGNINDTVTLPAGGSVTYTASCTIAPGTTGSLANTATVSAPAGVTDPSPGNNSATDTDTLTSRGGCDVNGDGRDEIVTGAGPGGAPHVRVLSLATGAELASFNAYDPLFGGGVFVGCGDIDGDGLADIITGAGAGSGPHVRAFSLAGAGPSEVASFLAYDPAFTGGVRVAAGDVTGDGVAEIITGAGAGGPHVRVFSVARGLTDVASFYAFDPTFTGGVFVAVGDVTGDGVADLVTGAGAGGGAHVRAFDLARGGPSEVANFFAYDPAFTGGVSVGGGM